MAPFLLKCLLPLISGTLALQIQRLTDSYSLSEGPHWDVASQSLYFVDVVGQNIVRYHPATKKLTHASTAPQYPTFIVPVEGTTDKFIISVDKELAIVTWDGESDKLSKLEKVAVADDAPEKANNTFNDGKCDSSGRLWAGTLQLDSKDFNKTLPLGTLYSFGFDLKLEPHVDKVRLSNGMAFNDRTKSMFFIDSLKQTVDRFDFDVGKGTIANREVWFTFAKNNIPNDTIPDGMTIDRNGDLWVAVFDGFRVIKISGCKPETLLQTIRMPAQKVTSVAFGGRHFDELYVTTATFEHAGVHLPKPVNGAVYRVRGVGARGRPAANFRLH